MRFKLIAKLVIMFGLLMTACSLQPAPEQSPTRSLEATKKDIPILTPTAKLTASSTPLLTLSPTQEQTEPERRSVFLISWDGARADLIYKMMAEGLLPNFRNLAENGLRAEYAVSIDPSLTAAAHNSMATGCYPDRTGIVSNSFHKPNDSFYWYRYGFLEPIEGGEPVWVTASRNNLISAVLFFPGGSPSLPTQMADYTIGYGVRDAYSNQLTIKMTLVEEEWEGEPPLSFSAPYEGDFVIPRVMRVYVYLFDSSNDGITNYDSLILNTERAINDSTVPFGVGDWAPLTLIKSTSAGADFLIQEINQEGPPVVTIFHSRVYHNIAAPRELLESLNQKFGFFPSGADSYALEHGWITHEDYLHMLERASLWMANVSAWVYSTYQPDLLMTWQNNFDAAGHAWFMHNDNQPNYSTEKAIIFQEYYRRAAMTADQALDSMLDVINLEETTLMLVGDHGMASIHTTVYVNTILEDAGLLKLDKRNYVVVDQSKAFAVASGGAVHIYINLIDREKDGIVPAEEYPQLQEQIVELFSSLKDPETGEAIFQRVMTRENASEIRLNHPNSGDVFAQANPGYNLDGYRGKKSIIEPAKYYGQHGYDSTLPEMHTIFIATGAGVLRWGEEIPPVIIIDYAPTIAALLEFDPPSTIDGNPITAFQIKRQK